MKKFWVFAFAALLVVAFSAPAVAMVGADKVEFGGYWRTRFVTEQNFNGSDNGSCDRTLVDTRSRFFLTFNLHDNLKFVNAFEIDAVWGGPAPGGWADMGTDGQDWQVKWSYVDFTINAFNFKIGAQPGKLARGFLIGDDWTGAMITYKADNWTLPFMWVKAYEGMPYQASSCCKGSEDSNDYDIDAYGIAPSFTYNEVKFNPYFVWITTDDNSAGSGWNNAKSNPEMYFNGYSDNIDLFLLGADVDFTINNVTFWGTAIYEFGTIDMKYGIGDQDVNAWLLNAGLSFNINDVEIHGEFIFATGDDEFGDGDVNDFLFPAALQLHPWAELMGEGFFDMCDPNNTPGNNVSNVIAFNLGFKFMPYEKTTLRVDVWHATLEESLKFMDASGTYQGDCEGEDTLGTEIDVRLTYEIMQYLTMDVVGAYLWAGDAVEGRYTYKSGPYHNPGDTADPWELGMQLTLSF